MNIIASFIWSSSGYVTYCAQHQRRNEVTALWFLHFQSKCYQYKSLVKCVLIALKVECILFFPKRWLNEITVPKFETPLADLFMQNLSLFLSPTVSCCTVATIFSLCGLDSSFLQGQALQQVQRTQLSPFSLNQTWRMKAKLRSNDCLQDTNHMVVMRPSAQENHENMN